jgi:replicative DNA helicase
MGKTALLMNLIRNMSINRNIPCAIFSLEMSSAQLELRLETLLSGISYSNLQNGRFNDEQLLAYDKGRSAIKTAPIYIDDNSRNQIEDVRTIAIQLKHKYGIKAIFLDYLQLMDGGSIKGQNREGQISDISRGLKSLAKELDIPVIALSQLNREVEKLNPPEPKLSHLRESGSIEMNADIVAFLYRPEYYGIETITKAGEVMSTENLCVVDFAKHRNGSTGKVLMKFYKNTMTFADYTNAPEPTDWLEPVAAKQEELFDEPSTDKPF